MEDCPRPHAHLSDQDLEDRWVEMVLTCGGRARSLTGRLESLTDEFRLRGRKPPEERVEIARGGVFLEDRSAKAVAADRLISSLNAFIASRRTPRAAAE